MGVQKTLKKSSHPNLRFENCENSVVNNNNNNNNNNSSKDAFDQGRLNLSSAVCSSCLTSCEKSADDLIKFHDKMLCESCLRAHISSHYRRKFLKDITFDLRQINQVRPLHNTKQTSLTLESLSLKSTSTETTSVDERPKSCSDSLMDLDNSSNSTSETNKKSENQEKTEKQEICAKCQLPWNSETLEMSHDCVATLKETLMEVQNTLEVFKSRCKEQIRAFLQRESNLINHMVSIQSEVLVQNKKNKSKMQKLEAQNAELLAKVCDFLLFIKYKKLFENFSKKNPKKIQVFKVKF